MMSFLLVSSSSATGSSRHPTRGTLNPLITYQIAARNLHVGTALPRMVRVWFAPNEPGSIIVVT